MYKKNFQPDNIQCIYHEEGLPRDSPDLTMLSMVIRFVIIELSRVM